MSSVRCLLSPFVFSLALAGSSWAQTPGAPASSPVAADAAAPAAPATPGAASPATPALPEGGTGVPAVPIDARTAVARALANSPSFSVTRLGVSQAQQDVLAEEGRYPFVLGAGLGTTHRGSPGGSQRSYDASVGVSRTWSTGTSAEVRVAGQRFETDSDFPSVGGGTNLPDGYATSARATITQPLLRGAGKSVGELGLRTARQSRTLAEQSERRGESELVRDVLLAYTELWYADESVRIERAALALARAQEQQSLDRQRSGALAPADVLTFQTRVAGLEEALLMTLTAREERSRELSRLMGARADEAPALSAANLPEAGRLPTASEVAAALRAGSLELAELETQVKLARTRAEVAGDSSRPRLDLEGYLEAQGEDETPGGAFRRAGELDWWTVHVGATFELPLDDTRHRAERQSALLSVRMAEQSLKAARDRLAADAVNTVARASAAHERVSLSSRTVALAERAHEAARGRYELGGGIALQVQEAEEDLRRARLSLARTRVDLVQAEIAVRHLAGTLLGEFKKS